MMKPTSVLFLLTLLATAALAFDKECNLDQRSLPSTSIGYNGFRILRTYTYGFPALHHNRLVYCKKGKVLKESYKVVSQSTSVKWNSTFCFDDQKCYRLVRRKKYALRSLDWYFPGVFIGGLYSCPYIGECTNENAELIAPIQADRTWLQFFRILQFRRLVQQVPYASTPQLTQVFPSIGWVKSLDVNEEYSFSGKELYLLTKMNNIIIGWFRSLLDDLPRGALASSRSSLQNSLASDFELSTSTRFVNSLGGHAYSLITNPFGKFR